jgi:hypothetical protein
MGYNTNDTFSAFEETVYTSVISSGALTLDFNLGQYAKVALTENITSVTILNAPVQGTFGSMNAEFTQDATGSRTVTGSYLTDGGSGLDISSAANSISVVSFVVANGTTLGMSAGKGYS